MKDRVREHLSEEQIARVAQVRGKTRLLSAAALGAAAGSIERAALGTGVATDRRPSGSDVLAGYARGWVLFGLRGARRFEWRSYPNRAVITADTAKVPKRVGQVRRKLGLEVRFGEDHDAIIERCQEGRDGWLTAEVADVYRELRGLGCLGAVGTYQDGRLVGGLWGPAVGGTFGIMSMFHTVDHAGAIALAGLSDAAREGEWSTVDCGELNENFRRYGAREIPTQEFCERIWRGISAPLPTRAPVAATPPPAR